MQCTTSSRPWKQLCLLFTFSSTLVHGQNDSCSSAEFSFEKLDKQLQNTKNCLEAASYTWTSYQNAKMFNQLEMLSDIIQKNEHAALQRLLPENCSAPAVPKDGGLLCGSMKNKIYCKPMCNMGYDFNFLRRSRLFEECSAATKHGWTTQFIGSNKLAFCDKSNIAVSGAPSAYFPEGQDCHKTKSSEQLMGNITNIFQSELAMSAIKHLESFRLICG